MSWLTFKAPAFRHSSRCHEVGSFLLSRPTFPIIPQPRHTSTMFSDRTNWKLEANRLSEALAKRRKSGQPVLDLTASNPTTCGFSYPGGGVRRALPAPNALVHDPAPGGLFAAGRGVVDYSASHKVQV